MGKSCKEIEKLIIKYVNKERRKKDIHKLRSSKFLKNIAINHSHDMIDSKHIYHGDGVRNALKYNPIYERSKGVVKKLLKFLFLFITPSNAGCASGENVAMMPKGKVKGYKKEIKSDKDIAYALFKNWLNSPGHRRNMLSSNFSHIGVGVRRRKNYFYATQLFYG